MSSDFTHMGKEGVDDHQRVAERENKIIQKIKGVIAQVRGAKWGI